MSLRKLAVIILTYNISILPLILFVMYDKVSMGWKDRQGTGTTHTAACLEKGAAKK